MELWVSAQINGILLVKLTGLYLNPQWCLTPGWKIFFQLFSTCASKLAIVLGLLITGVAVGRKKVKRN